MPGKDSAWSETHKQITCLNDAKMFQQIPVARGFGLQWHISLIWWGREVILSLVSSTSADSAAVDGTKWNPRLIHPVSKPAGKTKRCNNYRLNNFRVVEFIVQWFAWIPWHLGSLRTWFLQCLTFCKIAHSVTYNTHSTTNRSMKSLLFFSLIRFWEAGT